MNRRSLDKQIVRQVLAVPGQCVEVRLGRIVAQSQIAMGSPEKMYLIRVFVDVDRSPAEVVTVYRTTKISKYWRAQQ